jgi:hypothetical protein
MLSRHLCLLATDRTKYEIDPDPHTHKKEHGEKVNINVPLQIIIKNGVTRCNCIGASMDVTAFTKVLFFFFFFHIYRIHVPRFSLPPL